jgi:hypothetical protein
MNASKLQNRVTRTRVNGGKSQEGQLEAGESFEWVNSTTDRRVSSFGLVALAIGTAPRTASNDLVPPAHAGRNCRQPLLLLLVSRARARLQL